MPLSNNNVHGNFFKNFETAIKGKKMSMKIRKFKSIPFLAQILIEQNLIHTYFQKKNYFIIILYPNTYPHLIKKIQIFTKKTQPCFLKYQKLCTLRNFMPLDLLVLSTSIGILTNQTALKKKIGGRLIAKISI
jgi:ribosomal protein S8